MFNIEKFLEKFSRNIKNVEIYRKQVLEIIKKQTNIELGLNLIEIRNNIIYIKSNPVVLNKIFIYKKQILEDISVSLSIKIVDIR